MPKIFLKFNEQVLKEIPLDKPRLTIGRKPDNDLVIDNPAMSGHHALIFSEERAMVAYFTTGNATPARIFRKGAVCVIVSLLLGRSMEPWSRFVYWET